MPSLRNLSPPPTPPSQKRSRCYNQLNLSQSSKLSLDEKILNESILVYREKSNNFSSKEKSKTKPSLIHSWHSKNVIKFLSITLQSTLQASSTITQILQDVYKNSIKLTYSLVCPTVNKKKTVIICYLRPLASANVRTYNWLNKMQWPVKEKCLNSIYIKQK